MILAISIASIRTIAFKRVRVVSPGGFVKLLPGSTVPDGVVMMTRQDAGNYPTYFESVNSNGKAVPGGKYTCFKRSHSYQPFYYHVGYLDSGIATGVGLCWI